MPIAIKSFIRGILYPKGTTPLRWKEIIILFVSLFSTSLTITTMSPFLPAMVKFFGKTEEETGYFAGLIASSMFFGRCLSSYFWGILADKVGRKPVIISSLIIVGINTIFFGLSSSVTMAMTTRFLVGLGNGVIGTCKAMISEVCDATNQSLGMSTITISFTTGLIIGPALGGFLSETGLKYPEIFPKGSFFDQNPFLLPCVVNSVLLLFSAVICFKFLPETLIKSKSSSKKSKCSQMCKILQKRKEIRTTKTSCTKQFPRISESLELYEMRTTLPCNFEDLAVQQDRNTLFIDELDTRDLSTSCKTEQENCLAKLKDDNVSETQIADCQGECTDRGRTCLNTDSTSNVKHKEHRERKEKLKECQPMDITVIHNDVDNIGSKEDFKELSNQTTLHDDEDVQSDEKTECTREENRTECDNIGENIAVFHDVHNNPTDNKGDFKKLEQTTDHLHVLDEDDLKSFKSQTKQRTISHDVHLQYAGKDDSDIPSEQLDVGKENLLTVSCKYENEENTLQSCTRKREITNDNNKIKESEKALCCKLSSNKNSNLWRILRNRNAVLVLAIYVLYGFSQTAIDELIYIWAAADPRLGGLGFDTDNMGTFQLVVGLVITILQPTFLPKVERKLGSLMNLQGSVIVSVFLSVTLPAIRIANNRPYVLWPLLLSSLVMYRIGTCAAYLSIFLLLNNSIKRDLLCSVNGLGLTLSSLSKSISPTIGGSLFSWSSSSGKAIGFPFNVNMAFIFFGLIHVATVVISCFISENLNEPLEEEKVLGSSKSMQNILEAKT